MTSKQDDKDQMQVDVEQPTVVQLLKDHVIPFSCPLPAEQEGEMLDQIIPGSAEVVLLGESTHGTLEFYQLRRQLTRHLVQNRNFRVILIEAEWPDIYIVNQYLTQAKSPYPNVASTLAQLQGHGKHMWQNPEAIALLEWIKQFNTSQGYQPETMVCVFGIDCQQIYRSLNALYGILQQIDFTLCSDLKARLSFFNGYNNNEHDYARQTTMGIGSEQIPDILQSLLSEFQWKHLDRIKAQLMTENQQQQTTSTTTSRSSSSSSSSRVNVELELLNIEQNLEVLVNAEEYFRKQILEPRGSNASWNTRDQVSACVLLDYHHNILT